MSLLSSIPRWLGVFVVGVVMSAAVHAQGNLEIDTPAIAALKVRTRASAAARRSARTGLTR